MIIESVFRRFFHHFIMMVCVLLLSLAGNAKANSAATQSVMRTAIADLSVEPFSHLMDGSRIRRLDVSYLHGWLAGRAVENDVDRIELQIRGSILFVDRVIELNATALRADVKLVISGGGGSLYGWQQLKESASPLQSICPTIEHTSWVNKLHVYEFDREEPIFGQIFQYTKPIPSNTFLVKMANRKIGRPAEWPLNWLGVPVVRREGNDLLVTGTPMPLDLEDVAFFGSLTYEWARGIYPIKLTGQDTLKIPLFALSNGWKENGKFKYLNTCDGLMSENTWVAKRKLLVTSESADIISRVLLPGVSGASSAIRMSGVSDVSIDTLGVEGFSGSCISILNARNIAIRGVTVSGCAHVGMSVLSSQGVKIIDSSVEYSGSAGIFVAQYGDRLKLNSGDIVLSGNKVSHSGLLIPTYSPAIWLDGVGATVRGNYVHDVPHSALIVRGNDNVIDGNLIINASRDIDDAGVIYMGRSLGDWGNVIRNNLILFGATKGDVLRRTSAVYIDDEFAGTIVEDNIIVDYPIGLILGGGRQNILHGNIVVNASLPLLWDERGLTWQNSARLDPAGPYIRSLVGKDFSIYPYKKYNLKRPVEESPGASVDNIIKINKYCSSGRELVFAGANSKNTLLPPMPCDGTEVEKMLVTACNERFMQYCSEIKAAVNHVP